MRFERKNKIMGKLNKNDELLRIPEVIEEIRRHLWIESEKSGYDLGFEWAAKDWLNRFAKAWIGYHRPHWVGTIKSANNKISSRKRGRSAKKYI